MSSLHHNASNRDLGDHLQSLLVSYSSKPRAKSMMAPALAFGRHRGPANANSRLAAVFIAIYWQDGGWTIPLTMRPQNLKHHGGQICLPGGQIEPNETPVEAAIREYEEELGIKPVVSVQCGELSNQYVFGSDNRVRTVVATIETPSTPWAPDPTEVDEVIPLPLGVLLDETNRVALTKTKAVRQNGMITDYLKYSAPAIQCGEHFIWGATALILDELAQLLRLPVT